MKKLVILFTAVCVASFNSLAQLAIICTQKAEIEIMNNQGQTIKRLLINDKRMTLDISNLSSGIYIIKAKTGQGMAIKKLIKQ